MYTKNDRFYAAGYCLKRKVNRSETGRCILLTFLFISIAGGIIFMYIVVNTPGMWEKVFGEKNDYYATPASISYTEIKGANVNYQKPEINLEEVICRYNSQYSRII